MTYLYGITEESTCPVEAWTGIDGTPVRSATGFGLSAVYGDVPRGAGIPTPRRLVEHERVVEGLMTGGPVLPARFATELDHPAVLLDLLGAHTDQYRDDLERLRGRAEVGLRVVRVLRDPAYDDLPGGDGCPTLDAGEMTDPAFQVARRAAVVQRTLRRRDDAGAARTINETMSDLAIDHVIRSTGGADVILSASYLIEKKQIKEVKHVIMDVQKMYGRLHVFVSGPWPPYHFSNPLLRS